MNEYMLDPRDHIRVLEDAVELLCERTMVFFDLDQVTAVQFLRGCPGRALAFTCADALLGAVHQVLVPEDHVDFTEFSAAFLAKCPETAAPGVYRKISCDQTGSHHRH